MTLRSEFFVTHKVSELCLGKLPLKSIQVSATIVEAIELLRSSDETFVSVWNCDHSEFGRCECVGKVCMVDVICYVCKQENIVCPSKALKASISHVLNNGRVKHMEPSSSLSEAIDLLHNGAQNIVVPILQTKRGGISKRNQQEKSSTINSHNGEFCWITQEDIIKFILGSICLFTTFSSHSIRAIGVINSDVLAIDYFSPASSAVEAISKLPPQQTSAAIVDRDGKFMGEISPFTLAYCDETVAAAITTYSARNLLTVAAAITTLYAGDLMAYIDCGGPPEHLVSVVKARLKEKNLNKLLQKFTILTSVNDGDVSSSSTSNEESHTGSGKYGNSSSYSSRFVRKAKAIVCHPKSSLCEVMIEAAGYGVNYVWVIDDDRTLVGIVTMSSILKEFNDSCM